MFNESTPLPNIRDAHFLPVAARAILLNTFGQELSPKEIYTHKVSSSLLDQARELALIQPSESAFEALSYSLWLNPVAIAIERTGWPKKYPAYSVTPTQVGHMSRSDCIVATHQILDAINDIYTHENIFRVRNTGLVNFVSGSTIFSPLGESQNMAYFELHTSFSQPTAYLVDAAAYYYNPVWAKAFAGSPSDNLIERGIKWLTKAVRGSNWHATR